MKLSNGFTRPIPSLLIFFFYGLSLVFLTLTLKRLDVSVAYAVWSGLGVGLISAIGLLWFGEPMTTIKFVSLLLIVAGVIGLNLEGAH